MAPVNRLCGPVGTAALSAGDEVADDEEEAALLLPAAAPIFGRLGVLGAALVLPGEDVTPAPPCCCFCNDNRLPSVLRLPALPGACCCIPMIPLFAIGDPFVPVFVLLLRLTRCASDVVLAAAATCAVMTAAEFVALGAPADEPGVGRKGEARDINDTKGYTQKTDKGRKKREKKRGRRIQSGKK